MFRLVNQMKLWEVWVLVLWIKEKKTKTLEIFLACFQ